MRTASLLVPLLVPFVAAIPALSPEPTPTPIPTPTVTPRAPHRLDPTAVWISVDKSGKPSTVTPVATSVSGSAAIVDGAPNALTGTVFTITDKRNAKVTTSTGEPPLPTASNKKGKGAFAPCHNADGKGAPYCSPTDNDEVVVGKTYYVTFDTSVPMLKSNTTQKLKLRLLGNFVNSTGELGDEIVHSKFVKPAAHGFFPWDIEKKTVPSDAETGTIRLSLQRVFVDEDGEEEIIEPAIPGPIVKTFRPPRHDTGHGHGSIPAGAELYIALPTVFGALALIMIGGLLWSRSRRRMRFGLGNVAAAGRKGYQAARMGRAQKMLNKMKKKRGGEDGEQGVQLLERETRDYDESDDEGQFIGQEGWGGNAHRRQSREGYKES